MWDYIDWVAAQKLRALPLHISPSEVSKVDRQATV